MLISDFDYPLPMHLIADRPVPDRSASRLMVIDRRDNSIHHTLFKNLPDFLQPGDLVISNNTKVIPARLFGIKRGGGAHIEILLLEQETDHIWNVLAQRSIRLSKGTIIDFKDGSYCQVLQPHGEGRFQIRFYPHDSWEDFLRRCGQIPLPPYISRRRENLDSTTLEELERLDLERYQTIFAKFPGSAAAPTAGLHFDESILQRLSEKGIQSAWVTLHVGLDTFQPIKVDQIEDHTIHSEWCYCPKETYQKILETRAHGHRVMAVGTTTCRTLESYSRLNWPTEPIRTELFLKPGDCYHVVDILLTNFHLPRSTLLLLVSAFMGNGLREKAYQEAITEQYRFYSYGDAMLIL